MADGLILPSGGGGGTVWTDEIGGTHYPIGKIAYGVLDTALLVSDTNPFPIRGTAAISGTASVFISNSATVAAVTGTVNVHAVDAGTIQSVIGTVNVHAVDGGTVTISGAVDTELPAAAALADAAANPTVPGIGAYLALYNGATWDRVRGDTANGLDVDVTRVGGTVNVHAVDAGTVIISGNVNAHAVDAGTVLLNGGTAFSSQDDRYSSGGTVSTMKRFNLNAVSSGVNTVVSGVTSKKIRVLKWTAIAAPAGGTLSICWKDGAVDLSGTMGLTPGAGVAEPYCPLGLMETTAGSALQLNLSAAGTVGGYGVYVEVA